MALSVEGRLLHELEDVIAKVEREREVSWREWIALARVVYFLLKERHREKVWGKQDGRHDPSGGESQSNKQTAE